MFNEGMWPTLLYIVIIGSQIVIAVKNLTIYGISNALCFFLQQFKLVEWINKRCNICTIFVKRNSSFSHAKNTVRNRSTEIRILLFVEYTSQNIQLFMFQMQISLVFLYWLQSVLFHMTNHYLWPAHVMNRQQFQSLAGEFYVLFLEQLGKQVGWKELLVHLNARCKSNWHTYTWTWKNNTMPFDCHDCCVSVSINNFKYNFYR